MHIDEALAGIRKCASELGYSCKEETISESRINCVYSLNNVNINVWYSGKDNFFGFDMIQGGQKTYGSIDDFKKYIALYMNINAVTVPTAKVIADEFEKEIGVQSVYQNFKGNQDTGFTCWFSILNKDNSGIKIKEVKENLYLAQYIVQDEMGGHVELEKTYVVDDVGNVYVQVTIKDYIEALYERYSNSDSVNIRRYGEYDFEFDIDNKIHINASVEVVDILNALKEASGVSESSKFYYKVHSAVTINGKELVEGEDVDVKLDDVFDLSSLADYFLNSSGDKENSSDDNDFEYDDDDDTFEDEEPSNTFEQKESISGMQDIIDEKKPKLSGLDDLIEDEGFEDDLEEDFKAEEDEDFEEDSDDGLEEDFEAEEDEDSDDDFKKDSDEGVETEEELKEDSSKQEDIKSVSEINEIKEETLEDSKQVQPSLIEIKMILDTNETKIGVRFSYSDKIYDMSLDAAKEAGLPINLIQSSVKKEKIRGMLITDEEFSRRIFAEDVSEDKNMCKKLVNDFFM